MFCFYAFLFRLHPSSFRFSTQMSSDILPVRFAGIREFSCTLSRSSSVSPSIKEIGQFFPLSILSLFWESSFLSITTTLNLAAQRSYRAARPFHALGGIYLNSDL